MADAINFEDALDAKHAALQVSAHDHQIALRHRARHLTHLESPWQGSSAPARCRRRAASRRRPPSQAWLVEVYPGEAMASNCAFLATAACSSTVGALPARALRASPR